MRTQLHYIYIKERKARRNMEKEFLKSPAEVKKGILNRRNWESKFKKFKMFVESIIELDNFISVKLNENNPRT